MNWEIFRPTYLFACVEDIGIDWLWAKNIKCILLDVDNTIAVWNEDKISPEVDVWLRCVLESDIRVLLISNSGARRLRALSEIYGIEYISWAGKPFSYSFTQGLKKLKCLNTKQAIVVGDQIFTDVWGGNRLGLTTVLIRPRYQQDYIWTKLMRCFERIVMKKLKIRQKT